MSREVVITPEQFRELQLILQLEAALGTNIDAAIVKACRRIGIEPPDTFEPLAVIVDGVRHTCVVLPR